MKDVFQQQHEEEGDDIVMVNGKPQLSPEAQARRTERERKASEEKAKERQERVDKLAANLVRKLSIFTEAAKGPDDPQVGPSFKEICRLEAEDLKEESYGVDLLHSIGHTYKARSAQHLVSSGGAASHLIARGEAADKTPFAVEADIRQRPSSPHSAGSTARRIRSTPSPRPSRPSAQPSS